MTTIKLNKNYFKSGHHFLGYSLGENGYSGMGWTEEQLQELVTKFNLGTEFLNEESTEVKDEVMSEIHKLWRSFKTYHLIDNGSDKKIAYPGDMPIDLVDALEQARKNNSFVTLSSGDMQTGESWGDLYDQKGCIGLSRGSEYLYPILVSFETGCYEEDSDITIGNSYDFLAELHTSDIAKYLDEHGLDIEDVLDDGGTSILSAVAVQTGLVKNTLLYKHPNFTPKHDFTFTSVEEETFTTVCKTTSDKSEVVKETKKVEKKFVLKVNGDVYSRHDSMDELEKFLRANKQINLVK